MGAARENRRMTAFVASHMTITGRVQGVMYRASMVAEAERLDLTGWVRNRIDGSVEAFAQGDPERVHALAEWARRGPARANVTGVVARSAPVDAKLPPRHFERRETV